MIECLTKLIEILANLSSVALLFVALFSLNMWRKQIKYNDLYQTIKTIQIELIHLQKLFDEVRIRLIHAPIELTDEQFKYYIKHHQEKMIVIWGSYDSLLANLKLYQICLSNDATFMNTLTTKIENLIKETNYSIKAYYRHAAKIEILPPDELDKVKTYSTKWSTEDDPITLKFNQLITDGLSELNKIINMK